MYIINLSTSHAFIRGRVYAHTVRNGTEVVCVRNVLLCVRYVCEYVASQKLNTNKVNMFYCTVFILVASCSFRCTLSLCNLVTNIIRLLCRQQRNTPTHHEWPTKSTRCDHLAASTPIVSSENVHSLTAIV